MQYFIYQLRCPITKDVKYIGQTTKIKQRFDQHKWGCKEDSQEKKDWISELKNQKLQPLLEVIDAANNKKDALNLEKSYIVKYIELGESLLNIDNSTILKQYNKEGELVATYNTIREAAKIIGTYPRTRRGLCIGHLFTYGDFDKTVFEKIKESKKVNCKIVIQKTKSGEFINEFFGVREACRITGIDHRSIASVAGNKNPKRHNAGGFKWEYKI